MAQAGSRAHEAAFEPLKELLLTLTLVAQDRRVERSDLAFRIFCAEGFGDPPVWPCVADQKGTAFGFSRVPPARLTWTA